MILTLPDHDERRRIINKMHRTKDKDLCRKLNAILLVADGHSVSLFQGSLPPLAHLGELVHLIQP
jgi:hypothetical protein